MIIIEGKGILYSLCNFRRYRVTTHRESICTARLYGRLIQGDSYLLFVAIRRFRQFWYYYFFNCYIKLPYQHFHNFTINFRTYNITIIDFQIANPDSEPTYCVWDNKLLFDSPIHLLIKYHKIKQIKLI